jgi:hypothetical protein
MAHGSLSVCERSTLWLYFHSCVRKRCRAMSYETFKDYAPTDYAPTREAGLRDAIDPCSSLGQPGGT